MIKYEVGEYLPRYGRPVLVTVVEVHEAKREWIEENYAFLPEREKLLGSRFRTDFSKVDFPNGYFQPADLMEEAVRRSLYLVENFVHEENAAMHRDLFFSTRAYARTDLGKAPFLRFKLFGNFVPEMRTIAKSTDSDELRAVVKEALKTPTVRRVADRFP